MMKGAKASILQTLIGLCALYQAACATPSPVIQTEILAPPSALLVPCERPRADALRTNQDLAHFASAALLAWERCAAQIDALRLFYAARNNEEPENGEK